jgi:hypothetical protein
VEADMANRYYPEFYLRKRQREAAYKRITWGLGVVAFIAAGVFTGYLIYKNVVEPRQTQPGATPEAAAERTTLSTQARLAGMENQPVANAAPATELPGSAAPVLDDLPYEQSLPSVQVSVSAGGAASTGATPAGAETPAAADAQQPLTGDAAETPPPASAEPNVPNAAETAPPEAIKPPTTPQEAKKPTPQEKPKDKPKEEPKEKPKDKPKEPAKPTTPAESKPSGNGSFVYRVYAGSYASEEAAQSNRDQLKSLGMSGAVKQSGGEYNLFVTELTDLSAATALVNKLKSSGFGAAFASRKKS